MTPTTWGVLLATVCGGPPVALFLWWFCRQCKRNEEFRANVFVLLLMVTGVAMILGFSVGVSLIVHGRIEW